MEELLIQIECLKQDVRRIESEVYSFSEYGRSPNSKDYDSILMLLQKRLSINLRLRELENLKDAIISNKEANGYDIHGELIR